MLQPVPALTPLVILGIQDRWWILGAAVVLIVLALLALASRRRGGGKLDIRSLPADQAARYLSEMDQAENSFVDNPQQATARARGLVEEVLRRKGFPDRIDSEQRLRDLQRVDRGAAQSLKDAYTGMRNQKDTEGLRKSLQSFRDALRRLVGDEARPAEQGGVSPEATVG